MGVKQRDVWESWKWSLGRPGAAEDIVIGNLRPERTTYDSRRLKASLRCL